MIYNRYAGWRKYVMRGRFLRKVVYALMKPKLKKKAKEKYESNALFTSVEIETINRCNGVCPFCPVNHNDDPREFAMMTEELFDKIIGELSELDYRGTLSLYSNNEPFLDKRIIDFAKRTRERVPNAKISIFTNGTILTKEMILEIIPYLDNFVIDNYDDDLKLNKGGQLADEICREHPEYDQKIQIHLRKLNEVLYTRGGQAPNNKAQKTFDMPCIIPFGQMVIRPTGKVSLCCNDALGVFTMGDVNENSMVDIWNNNLYKKVRSKLMYERSGLKLCQYCDTFSM